MSNFYSIRNKALANGLHWLTGQRYYRFQEEDGTNTYNFDRTPELIKALDEMDKLKKSIRKVN